MDEYKMNTWVFTRVDGARVECEICGLPEPGGTVYELNCQGETIRRDVSKISATYEGLQ